MVILPTKNLYQTKFSFYKTKKLPIQNKGDIHYNIADYKKSLQSDYVCK